MGGSAAERQLAEYMTGGLSLPAESVNKALSGFKTYFNLLVTRNEQINLTAITKEEEVYLKHFADSLSALPLIPAGARVLDMGSGAGFPGVPLKIARPDIEITLADSLNKRIEFLKEVCAALNINAALVHTRAEDFKKRGCYDIVCARAVAALPTLLEYTLPFVKTGGLFLAYKTAATEGELALSENALKQLGGKTEQVYTPALYGGLNHIIIAVRKTAETPVKYPRGGNKPRLNPL